MDFIVFGNTAEAGPYDRKGGEVYEHVSVGETTGDWVTGTFDTVEANGVWNFVEGEEYLLDVGVNVAATGS